LHFVFACDAGRDIKLQRESEGGTNFSANEKAARQRGRPFLSRENSSIGGCFFRQNFLAKSYEPQIRGVKRFLGIKYVYFQQHTNCVNKSPHSSKMEQFSVSSLLTRIV
jgi:hypothetical protein